MKRNGHLTFQCVIDYWGTHSDAKLFYGMPGTSPGAFLSFNVAHMDSIVIIVLLKVNKQVEGKIRNWIRNQRTKKQGNKGTAKKLQNKGGYLYLQIY